MFYFDPESFTHLAFVALASLLLMLCVSVIIVNWRKGVPIRLPERSHVGESNTVDEPDDVAGPNGDADEGEKRDKVEIFIIAPEFVPFGSTFRIIVNVNNFSGDDVAAEPSVAWQALVASLRKGDTVGLTLDCDNLGIDTPYQVLLWKRRNLVAIFHARVPPVSSGALKSINKLSVLVGNYPIGEIDFEVRFSAELRAPERTTRRGTKLTMEQIGSEVQGLPVASKGFKATRFKSAFISYSRVDEVEMGLFCSGLDTHDIEIKLDQFEFRTGETWDDQAKALIDACDVVFLLWSPAAADSLAVAQEVGHAIKRRDQTGRPRLHPVLVRHSSELGSPPGVSSNTLWAGRFSTFLK